jgi:hypothetical protein
MELKLNRIYQSPTYTIGKLFANGQYLCDSIEDAVRDKNKDGDLDDAGEGKVMHKTAIPYGKYEVIVNMSNRFKKYLPLLLNVKGFEGIRIHSGVNEESSSGCIIVGKNTEKGKVTKSREWSNYLTDKLLADQKKKIKSYIEIV